MRVSLAIIVGTLGCAMPEGMRALRSDGTQSLSAAGKPLHHGCKNKSLKGEAVGVAILGVEVTGRVALPGQQVFRPGLTLGAVLSLAGGPVLGRDDAAAEMVVVLGRSFAVYYFPLNSVRAGVCQSIPVAAGDRVAVTHWRSTEIGFGLGDKALSGFGQKLPTANEVKSYRQIVDLAVALSSANGVQPLQATIVAFREKADKFDESAPDREALFQFKLDLFRRFVNRTVDVKEPTRADNQTFAEWATNDLLFGMSKKAVQIAVAVRDQEVDSAAIKVRYPSLNTDRQYVYIEVGGAVKLHRFEEFSTRKDRGFANIAQWFAKQGVVGNQVATEQVVVLVQRTVSGIDHHMAIRLADVRTTEPVDSALLLPGDRVMLIREQQLPLVRANALAPIVLDALKSPAAKLPN